jgi:hypothetical protein
MDLHRALNCTIQAVLEPCKVRIISKGEAIPYYASKPLQVALWSALQAFSCFKLTGRPFCPTDLLPLLSGVGTDFEWFSVDYSAATDGLSLKYSQSLLEYVISDLSPRQKDLMRTVLGKHMLNYPRVDNRPEIAPALQENGQLMGSPLSFPFLCLANLGVFLKNTESIHKGWSHKRILSTVLINGDDMLYAAPHSLWDSHVRIARSVGLDMTVGKAYSHHSYLNVNSTCAHLDLRVKGAQPFLIPFFNSGLFFGQHKVMKNVGSGEYEDNYSHSSAATVMEKVLLGCTNVAMQKTVASDYSVNQAEMLKAECSADIRNARGKLTTVQRNLFLPITLGGMGVSCPIGFKFEFKRIQQKIASSLYWEADCYSLPMTGYPLLDGSPGNNPWNISSCKTDKLCFDQPEGRTVSKTTLRDLSSLHRCSPNPITYDG